MRTITLNSTTPSLKLTLRHFLESPYRFTNTEVQQVLGNGPFDEFSYTPECFITQDRLRLLTDLNTVGPDRDAKAMIHCTITLVGSSATARSFSSSAFCWVGDSYSRLRGERLALQRAIEESEEFSRLLFSGTTRKAIWAAWLESYHQAVETWTDSPTGRTGVAEPPVIQNIPNKVVESPTTAPVRTVTSLYDLYNAYNEPLTKVPLDPLYEYAFTAANTGEPDAAASYRNLGDYAGSKDLYYIGLGLGRQSGYSYGKVFSLLGEKKEPAPGRDLAGFYRIIIRKKAATEEKPVASADATADATP